MSNMILKDETLGGMSTAVGGIAKCWHGLRMTGKTWNIKGARQNLEKMRMMAEGLAGQWEATEMQLTEQMEAIRSELGSPAYATDLERELKAAGIQFNGEFPLYVMPPFKLAVSLDLLEARLSLGRKSEKTQDLNPRQLAQWAAVRYKKVLARKFNATAFMKDLLEAYLIANRLHFRGREPSFGCAVPLPDLYNVLTLRQNAKADYPLQFFTFDVGLLIESAVLKMDKYVFEFGTPRDQQKALVVVDSTGRESRLSSLAVHIGDGGSHGAGG